MPGPIQIKREDIAADARDLAALMHVSITEAVGAAIRNQLVLEQVKSNSILAKRRAEAERSLAEIRRLPVVGRELTDSDLYDSEGMPK